jgi:hypothetical protein
MQAQGRGSSMHAQIDDANYESDVIPPVRSSKRPQPNNTDQLDQAGQTILQLVQKAAGVAEENSRHALGMAQKLSHQLRAAEDRLAELEARSPPINRAPTGPSSGSIASTRRLNSDFWSGMTGAAACNLSDGGPRPHVGSFKWSPDARRQAPPTENRAECRYSAQHQPGG